jgi:FlaA1/EpsC-like NDP-sugar epimerase
VEFRGAGHFEGLAGSGPHAEYYVQHMDKLYPNTRFITVRFGNVLGSSGSVVPIFKSQIEVGGPVMVTHPDMTRFFMTIPEAAKLLLQASAFGDGGEIFILDMGESVKIIDLAKNMINLLSPNQDIEIKFSGIRPGEKIYEELSFNNETTEITKHPKIKNTKTTLPSNDILQSIIRLVNLDANISASELRKELSALIPEAKLKD